MDVAFDLGYPIGRIVGGERFTGSRRQAALSGTMREDDPRPLQHLPAVFGGRAIGPYVHGDRESHLYSFARLRVAVEHRRARLANAGPLPARSTARPGSPIRLRSPIDRSRDGRREA